MGIVKVRLRIPEKSKNAKLGHDDSFSYGFIGSLVNSVVLANSDDDTDDYEFSMVGCEPVALEDQHFDVPYELYDLPDLKDVLSVETWNNCLSEEEKLSLSAYLPDMNQETFSLTMHELLKGEEIFFGNPSSIFFQRLKGGFYLLRVARFREGLQVLEKRIYYHSLKSYHENMSQVFMDMKRIWDTSQPSTNIQERLFLWKERKDHKHVFFVDLNELPEDDFLTKFEKDGDGASSVKRTRCMESKEVPRINVPAAVNTMASVASMTKPKGILKIKPPIRIIQSQRCNYQGPFSSAPKGVLKIKPRNVTVALEGRLQTMSVQPELASISVSDLHTSMPLPVLQSKNAGDMEILHQYPHFSRSKSRRDSSHRHPDHPLQLLKLRARLANHASDSLELQEQCLSRKRFLSTANFSCQESMVECQNDESSMQNSTLGNRELCSRHTGLEHFEGRRHITSILSSTPSRVSVLGSDHSKTLTKPSYLELEGRGLTCRGLIPDQTILDTQLDDLVLPLTYKRKKSHLKQSSSDSLNQPAITGSYESIMRCEPVYTVTEKIKPLKIKLKIWNE